MLKNAGPGTDMLGNLQRTSEIYGQEGFVLAFFSVLAAS